MAVTTLTLGAISGALLHNNTDVDETEDDVDSGAGTLYAIEIDNTANAAVTYVKLWNAASGAVTVGTTAPDFIFMCPASVTRTYMITQGIAYDTALTIGAVTTAGTAGVTGPTSAVTVRLVYT